MYAFKALHYIYKHTHIFKFAKPEVLKFRSTKAMILIATVYQPFKKKKTLLWQQSWATRNIIISVQMIKNLIKGKLSRKLLPVPCLFCFVFLPLSMSLCTCQYIKHKSIYKDGTPPVPKILRGAVVGATVWIMWEKAFTALQVTGMKGQCRAIQNSTSFPLSLFLQSRSICSC